SLVLSASASPIDTGAEKCPIFCRHTEECGSCPKISCVSFSGLCLQFNHMTHRHCRYCLYA
ncbi:hypothetical protein P692DRAFT_20676077, partial [Suillus brevipes Sb2]